MANVKKNTSKKPTATKKVQVEEVVVEQPKVVEEQVVVEKVVEEKPTKKEFGQSDGVKCYSVVSGKLYVQGVKTGMLYPFMDYGDETEIEYRDLVAMVRAKDKAVYEPRFIVSDKDFIAEFPALDNFYSKQFKTRDIKSILNMDEDEMVEAIKKLPNGAKESLKTIAAKMVSAGELDSVKKIKTLDEVLGTNLNLVGEMISD